MKRTGTLIDFDGRPALRFERRLAHPVERVWRAVTDPAELERWFVATVPWGPTEGETWEAYGQSGRITRIDPPHRLEWEWGDEFYAYRLTGDADGCVLVFTHVFVTTYGPSWQHATGWEGYLNRLEALLAGSYLEEEDAIAAAQELLEGYREDFEDD